MNNKRMLIGGKPVGLPPVEEMMETLAKRSKVTVVPGHGMIIEAKEAAKTLGSIGGKTTAARHGKKHFSEAGKKGMARRWGKNRLTLKKMEEIFEASVRHEAENTFTNSLGDKLILGDKIIHIKRSIETNNETRESQKKSQKG